jgi:hypothetical protein
MLGLVPYCAIVILAIIFRYNALDTQGYCYVGLRRESSFPLLIYDLIINVLLSEMTDSDLSHLPIPLANIGIVFV